MSITSLLKDLQKGWCDQHQGDNDTTLFTLQKHFLSSIDAYYLPLTKKNVFDGAIKEVKRKVLEKFKKPPYYAGRIAHHTFYHAKAHWIHSIGWMGTGIAVGKLKPRLFFPALFLSTSIGWVGTWPGKEILKRVKNRWGWCDLRFLHKACEPCNRWIGKGRALINYSSLVPLGFGGLSLALLLRPTHFPPNSPFYAAPLAGLVGGHYWGNRLRNQVVD